MIFMSQTLSQCISAIQIEQDLLVQSIEKKLQIGSRLHFIRFFFKLISKHNSGIFLSSDFNIVEICPISTPSAYKVISQRRSPSSFE